MAKLPNAESAFIDPRKVTHYLLDLRHPDGAPKAAYFMRFGFREEDPDLLMEALLEHGRCTEVVRLQKTAFGTNYIVEGPLSAPDGRRPRLRSVWVMVDGGAPRFVTAIPLKGGKS